MAQPDRAGRDGPAEEKPTDGWVLAALILTTVAVHAACDGVGVIFHAGSAYGTTTIFHSFVWLALAIWCWHLARRPERGMSSTLAAGVVLALAGAVVAVAACGAYAHAARSSATQASGAERTVAVPAADNYLRCPGCVIAFGVALKPPVAGRAATMVHVPGLVPYAGGQPVAIRVDPDDPGYAEFPGQPYATDGEALSTAVLAGTLLVLGLAGIALGARSWARKRSRRAADPVPGSAAGRRSRWAPVAAILWGLAAFFMVSMAESTLFAGAGGSLASAMLRGQNIIPACLWFAGAGTAFAFAVDCEHQARLPAAGSGQRVHAPVSALAGGIILLLLGFGFAPAALSAQEQASRSGDTQAHGVPEDVTVSSASAGVACSSDSCSYQISAPATLSRPVGGHTRTTVNLSGEQPDSRDFVMDAQQYPGRFHITALVDPRDPGYAELPQEPYTTEPVAVSMDVIAALTLALGVTGTVRGLRCFWRPSRKAAVSSGR